MKRIVLSIALLATLLVGTGLAYAAPVFAANPTKSARDEACAGISSQASGSCDSGADLTKTIKAIINVMSAVGGFVAVIMIIVAGIKYASSGGDPQAIGGAKKTLIYSVVGLVVVAFAQIIVHFVLFNAQK